MVAGPNIRWDMSSHQLNPYIQYSPKGVIMSHFLAPDITSDARLQDTSTKESYVQDDYLTITPSGRRLKWSLIIDSNLMARSYAAVSVWASDGWTQVWSLSGAPAFGPGVQDKPFAPVVEAVFTILGQRAAAILDEREVQSYTVYAVFIEHKFGEAALPLSASADEAQERVAQWVAEWWESELGPIPADGIDVDAYFEKSGESYSIVESSIDVQQLAAVLANNGRAAPDR